ncbi:MAG: zinc ABC transporter substrate-binding protein [Anaerolineae bacterium]|nr:zinc ABC transporter substrate-binding protein [Anaerolineae bacterium]
MDFKFRLLLLSIFTSLGYLSTGCSTSSPTQVEEPAESLGESLTLPAVEAVSLNGNLLRVVATTSIIGDVVSQVGGEAIDLVTLMGPGIDPHSYQPGAQDLTVVENAHVIFINGWDLEEALVGDLTTIGRGVPVIPISAGISPIGFDEHTHEENHAAGEERHIGVDPHVWFNVENVKQWVKNTEFVLSTLDPANSENYSINAQQYLGALETLEKYIEEQLTYIPPENRILVTNHDSFGYFAEAYGFEVLGTVIPAASTLAEPSAADLAELIQAMEDHHICNLFTEITVSDTLAQTVAGELDNCSEVEVISLYTGAVGPVGSGAENYIAMFRTNVDKIVEGLR